MAVTIVGPEITHERLEDLEADRVADPHPGRERAERDRTRIAREVVRQHGRDQPRQRVAQPTRDGVGRDEGLRTAAVAA